MIHTVMLKLLIFSICALIALTILFIIDEFYRNLRYWYKWTFKPWYISTQENYREICRMDPDEFIIKTKKKMLKWWELNKEVVEITITIIVLTLIIAIPLYNVIIHLLQI